MSRLVFYSVLILILLFVSAFLFFFGLTPATSAIVAIPWSGTLLAIIYQLINDNLAQERRLRETERAESFGLGVSSAMADTIFQKHVKFCEEYTQEAIKSISEINRNGLSINLLDCASNLKKVR